MYLNYAKIKSGQRTQPMLRLRTLSGEELGPIPFAHDLKFAINYSDLSTISFKVPHQVNGALNPLYVSLSSYKVVYTDNFGIYVLTSPQREGDGITEEKTVTGYSLEYLFKSKNLFLEEGTYNFWNPVSPSETILGRILELDPTWHVGYVAPRLIGCYRTFDQYNDNALNFCYADAMEKYRCAIVFDVYDKSINAYDANKDAVNLPIYLDYKNLIESVEIQEITDDLATKLHLYGSDDLTIRDVNPIGTDYIVDLSYFLSNGDLDIKVGNSSVTLADKVRKWQIDIAEKQQYYIGVVSSRASLTARKLSAETELTELKGELENLVAQQSVIIQAYSLEKTDSGKNTQQSKLDQINSKIASKKKEIAEQESKIKSIQTEVDKYMTEINSIVKSLSLSTYFTAAEQKILNQYMMEATVEEETFVSTDADTSSSGVVAKISGNISISESSISRVSLSKFNKTMYMLNGGKVSIPNANISAEIVRGTLDTSSGNSYVLTLYLGDTKYNGHDFDNGILTVNGTYSQLSNNISAVTENGVTEYKGTRLSFRTTSASSYFTVDANEFQKYSVALELYDFGYELLGDYAWPAYEFSINSANFLYQEKFEPFKNSLELGKAVYLNMGSDGILNAKIIGIELDFESINNFKLVFSNRYRLKNGVEKWINEIRGVTRSSRNFDVNKFLYGQAASKVSDVAKFLSNSMDAARNTILAAKNQSVVIDGAGIHVCSIDNPNLQLRIVNGMLAITDDNWEHAKVGIGLFESDKIGRYFGVNAEVIGGNLIVGNNLVIDTDDGHFKVDKSGVYIDSLRFYINNSKNLKDVFDDIGSDIGKVSDDVSSVRGDFDSVTTKTDDGITLNATDLKGVISAQQAQMKSSGGNVLFDSDGMWLLNGKTKATSTKAIWMNENGILFGSGRKTPDPGANWTNWTTAIGHNGIVADNIAAGTLSGMIINGGEITIGKSSSSDNAYLHVDSNGNLGIGKNTSRAKGYNFYVDSNGNMYANAGEFTGKVTATSGIFKGTVQASKFLDSSGKDMLSGGKFKSDYLDLSGITIRDSSNNISFQVANDGKVTINGKVTMGYGSSINWDSVNNKNLDKAPGYNIAVNAQNIASSASVAANNAQGTANSAIDTANEAYRVARAAERLAEIASDSASGAIDAAVRNAKYLVDDLADGMYFNGTFIDGTTVTSPTLAGNIMIAGSFVGNQFIARVDSGDRGGFALSTRDYGTILRIFYRDMGGFGPETVIYGNGGTLYFENWSHIDGVTATFA